MAVIDKKCKKIKDTLCGGGCLVYCYRDGLKMELIYTENVLS